MVLERDCVVPSKKLFREVAEEWYEAKSRRLRPRTADYYRQALDLVLLPRFGDFAISAIWVDDIASLMRDLEDEGYTRSTRAMRSGP